MALNVVKDLEGIGGIGGGLGALGGGLIAGGFGTAILQIIENVTTENNKGALKNPELLEQIRNQQQQQQNNITQTVPNIETTTGVGSVAGDANNIQFNERVETADKADKYIYETVIPNVQGLPEIPKAVELVGNPTVGGLQKGESLTENAERPDWAVPIPNGNNTEAEAYQEWLQNLINFGFSEDGLYRSTDNLWEGQKTLQELYKEGYNFTQEGWVKGGEDVINPGIPNIDQPDDKTKDETIGEDITTITPTVPGNGTQQDEEKETIPNLGGNTTVKDDTNLNLEGMINGVDIFEYLTNERNERWAREDEIRKETQEREDTAYQRAVEDMVKAGINPNLMNISPAASGGGITSQSGTNTALLEQQLNAESQILQKLIEQNFKGDENSKDRFMDAFSTIIGLVGQLVLIKGLK